MHDAMAYEWADNMMTDFVNAVRGPAPVAEDDFTTTAEETPVTVNVLANDREGRGGDDDDDDDDDDDREDFAIDPRTVDLRPEVGGMQSFWSMTEGTFSVDEIGTVTYQPSRDFSGTAVISYTVRSYAHEQSNTATLTIQVDNVNDVPVVMGDAGTLEAVAGSPLEIMLSHLDVTDPDHSVSDMTVVVLPGDSYTVSGAVLTPDESYSGTLQVPVVVSDGQGTSSPYTLAVLVTAKTTQSIAPTITGQQTLVTPEETALTIGLENLTVTDPDSNFPDDFTLTLSAGEHYNQDGNTVIPAPDFSGVLTVPVVVNDGVNNSPPFNLQITVTNVNDPPVISGQVPLSTAENTGVAIEVTHLVIADPDDDTFTLSLSDGEGYSVNGNIITPDPGFSGVLTVPVSAFDGEAYSNTFGFSITVNPVNDPPVITGQREIAIPEETSIAITLTDITVADPDNTYPNDFSLAILPGDNYTFAGNVVTPAADFTGVLPVNIQVSDGTANSNPFALIITITPVNDPPAITGQGDISTPEETARTIGFADLVVSDPDNLYPDDFTLLVFAGDHYSVDGNSILPSPDFSGSLTVPVQVSDGLLNSNVFELTVTVIPGNDKPVITGQVPAQTETGVPFTITLAHLIVLDSDHVYPNEFTLAVSPGAHYTVEGTTVYPAPAFNGTLNVSVTVHDGVESSDPFAFQIQIGNANQTPVITGQTTVVTNEEQAITITLQHLSVTDPDNTYPTGFSLLIAPGENYTVSGQTVTPVLDFSGVLTVPLRVNDGVNNSSTFNFQIQVNPVNDPPSFAAIPNQQVAENTPAGSVIITDISKGPGEGDQQLTFVATSGNTNVIADPVIQYDGSGTTATLSYSVVPNASGVVTLTVVAIDNGSNVPPHRNSYTSAFQVEVMEINQAPTLDPIADITIMEDAEQQSITLSGISAGAGETQTLTVSVSADRAEFFESLEVVYTSPSATGQLQFKTPKDVNGRVRLAVTVTDDGPGVAPHTNAVTRAFNVVVEPVNDPPFFASQPVTVAVEGERYEYHVVTGDPDDDKLTLTVEPRPDWLRLSPEGNGIGRLHGHPPKGLMGDVPVSLRVADGAAIVVQEFVIYVNVRPVLENLALTTEEDVPLLFAAGMFQEAYSDGNGNVMQAIRIRALPESGMLTVSEREVQAGDTIPVDLLNALVFSPDENFFGEDVFLWDAWDGFHFSAKPARVDLSVLPLNDPPRIVLQYDTLQYEVNGEAAFLEPLLKIVDPDDDTLSGVSVRFHSQAYRPQADVFEFDEPGGLRGRFDLQNGVLEFSGIAPLTVYEEALRSVRYTHLNTIDPILESKGVTFLAHDGKSEGQPADLTIVLQYTFVEFEIPTAFTPNGDMANDTWVIDRPGGGLEEMDDAIISVYNQHGVLVHRSRGFEKPWDGTMNGELLPAGTYFFTIDLQLRNRKTYKGIVTILR